jgi:hypothetical protein
MTETFAERIEKLAATLVEQGEAMSLFEKSERPTDSNLRSLKKELTDLKQITPALPSRAAPVIVGEISKSGLPSEVDAAIRERLRGNISADELYRKLGFR